MVRHKRSRALHIGAALVVSMMAAVVGCGASNDSEENASSTSAALSSPDKDGCTTNKGKTAHLADFGTGFTTICPPAKTGMKCDGSEIALQADLQAAGCRRCVGADGSYWATDIEESPREKAEWWCAVCPHGPAVYAILTNPQYTPMPLGVRAPRSCHGTDLVHPGGLGELQELVVEWDPRCPGGACSGTGPNGGS